MRIVKLAKQDETPDNYQEMKEWFDKRTDRHIERVQKFCQKIEDFDSDRFKGLIGRGEVHDQSKYKDPEYDPYVYLTWRYKCEANDKDFECPEGMDEKIDVATEHHITHNAHHPEFYSEKKSGLINRKDRDKPPEQMIDATKMKDIDIAEMVADWMAMSEEKENTPKSWADKNVNIRWKFTDEQKDLIYELIEEVWG